MDTTTITITVHAASLTPHTAYSDTQDLGSEAMQAARRFLARLEIALSDEYPDSNIRTLLRHGRSGDYLSECIDAPADIAADVESLYLSVWEDGADRLWMDDAELGKRLATEIANASSLDELASLLNNAVDAGLHVDRIPGLDMAALPTFGGPEPADTRGIYSWDADHFLAPDGDPDEPWALFEREDVGPVEVEASWFAEEIQDVCAASEWLDENGLDGCETLTVHPDGSIGVDGGGSIQGTHETYRLCVEWHASE